MNAKQLIEMVESEKQKNWSNSNLWEQSELMLEKIATHFQDCDLCRKEFDNQEYQQKTLLDFECQIQNTLVDDWICKDGKPRNVKGQIKPMGGENPRVRINIDEQKIIKCIRNANLRNDNSIISSFFIEKTRYSYFLKIYEEASQSSRDIERESEFDTLFNCITEILSYRNGHEILFQYLANSIMSPLIKNKLSS